MIKEKTFEEKYAICDICESEVGSMQLTSRWRKEKRHFCYSCWWVGLAIGELEHGKRSMKDNYYAKGHYKYNFNKLIKTIIDEAKKQTKKGKHRKT